ncbi:MULTISPECIES: type I polyketide synthase [unclassified Actinopolyspora]|uniref:type I polyketide synthase n=1 Tax=unclassified Actinopolyspora TaxID=2639451 RepID=UPI001A99F195
MSESAAEASFSRPKYEPIAVVGIGCRFAGGVDSPEAYWEVLRRGRDMVTEVPPDRWSVEEAYDPEPGVPGKTVSKWGGFVHDVGGFDPEFFGLSEREAEAMDPQHRLLLETAWESLEHAGIRPRDLGYSPTGLFLGISGQDYMMRTPRGELFTNPYAMTGNARSMAAGRISYLLGLRGPSVVLDSACSSGLVATHLAARSLQVGDADLALSGGVNLIFGPETTVAFSSWGMLSPAGRCRAFDVDASGFVRAEACGVLALKRLADAERDGDRVLAVLRGSGVNQDGRSNGITAPSGEAQRELQQQVIARSGVDPRRVGLVEAHGTGTPVGDPIEFAALADSYGHGDAGPCALGSAKTNIGHAETASGMAGAVKAVLALRHGEIPANLHFTGWNPEIDPAGTRLFVPTRTEPWPVGDGPRLAAVSSYGFSGTNAHVLLEQAPAAEPESACSGRAPLLVPFSASSPRALADTAGRVASWMERAEHVSVADLAHTTGVRRGHCSARATVAASDGAELVERLRAVERGDPAPGVAVGTAAAGREGDPVWVFAGQGAQWPGMGRRLLEQEPAFAKTVEELEPVVLAESGFSLRDKLCAEEVVTGIDQVQPALFAVQVGLAAVWRSHGVRPGAVIGHSMGEVAAAVVSGALSLTDGATVVCRRSRLMLELSGAGAMASVDLPAEEVERELAAAGARGVVVAVVAAPESTVVAGEAEEVARLVRRWDEADRMVREVAVDVASHSPQVAPILDTLLSTLCTLTPGSPEVAFYSTVLPGEDSSRLSFDAAYWADNLRRPVRFADAVSAALDDGHRVFAELGPHPLLTRAIGDTAAARQVDVAVSVALRRDEDDPAAVLSAIGAVHCAGGRLDWSARHPEGRLLDVPLPTWNHRWLMNSGPERSAPAVGHPLLGAHVETPRGDGEHVWQTDIGTDTHPWLAEHRVRGTPMMPAAGYGEMALSAAEEVFGADSAVEVCGLSFDNACVLDDSVTLSTTVERTTEHRGQVSVLGRGVDGGAVVHAHGHARALDEQAAPQRLDLAALLAEYTEWQDPEAYYANLRGLGIQHGPGFAALTAIHREGRGRSGLVSEVRLPAQRRAEADSYRVHPVLLDACLQTIAAHPALMDQSGLFLPLGIGTLRVFGDAREARYCVAAVHESGDRSGLGQAQLVDERGTVLVEVSEVRFGTSAEDAPDRVFERRLLAVEWDEAPAPQATRAAAGRWLLVTEPAGQSRADRLADELRSRGGTATVLAVDEPDELGSAVLSCSDGVDGVAFVTSPEHDRRDPAATSRQRVGRLTALAQALVDGQHGRSSALTVVLHDAQEVLGGDGTNLAQAPLRGLAKVIGHEHPELGVSVVDGVDTDPARLVGELLDAPVEEDEVAWRGDVRYLARLRNSPLSVDERLRETVHFGRDGAGVQTARRGDLDTLELAARERVRPGPGEVEIEIHAASLNYVDALNAMGLYNTVDDDPPPLGADCAGVVSRVGAGVTEYRPGDRVAAMMWGGLASHLTVPTGNVLAVPEHVSVEEAATMPAVYLTAWYGLNHLARLEVGERVLIHAATGGVGLAAIHIARARGAEVFATAGTPDKRAYLAELGVEHVMDSRSLDFAEQVLAATGGAGVDVVLNSVTGAAQRAGISLLRAGGRFLEIGKRDIYAEHRISLAPFRHNLTFASIDLNLVVDRLTALTASMLGEIERGAADGSLVPLPLTTYSVDELSAAFRTLGAGRHIGKIVLRIPTEGSRQVPVEPDDVPVVRAGGAYVVTGGLGGLGLLVARWLSEAGAARVVLNGRREPGQAAAGVLDELRAAGTDVRVVLGDLTEPDTARGLLGEAGADGVPVRGVVHGAAVVEDGVVSRLDAAGTDRVWCPKALGAWHLHDALGAGGHEGELDWLLLFSSAAALIGNPGQGAYAAANGFLDGLATYRRCRGLAATSVSWGAWAEHGRGADMADRGFAMIEPAEGIEACERILRYARARTGYLPLADGSWLDAVGDRARGSAFFAPQMTRSGGDGDESGTDHELLARIAEADEASAVNLLTEFVVAQAAAILRLDPAGVDPGRSLLDYGLDSLMGLELRTRLDKALRVRVPTKKLWARPEPSSLAAYLAGLLDGTTGPADA